MEIKVVEKTKRVVMERTLRCACGENLPVDARWKDFHCAVCHRSYRKIGKGKYEMQGFHCPVCKRIEDKLYNGVDVLAGIPTESCLVCIKGEIANLKHMKEYTKDSITEKKNFLKRIEEGLKKLKEVIE